MEVQINMSTRNVQYQQVDQQRNRLTNALRLLRSEGESWCKHNKQCFEDHSSIVFCLSKKGNLCYPLHKHTLQVILEYCRPGKFYRTPLLVI